MMWFKKGLPLSIRFVGPFTKVLNVLEYFNIWVVGSSSLAFGLWLVIDITEQFQYADVPPEISPLVLCCWSMFLVGLLTSILGGLKIVNRLRSYEKRLEHMTNICWALLSTFCVGLAMYLLATASQYEADLVSMYQAEINSYGVDGSAFVDNMHVLLSCCGYEDVQLEFQTFVEFYVQLPPSCVEGLPLCPGQFHDLVQRFSSYCGFWIAGNSLFLMVNFLLHRCYKLLPQPGRRM